MKMNDGRFYLVDERGWLVSGAIAGVYDRGLPVLTEDRNHALRKTAAGWAKLRISPRRFGFKAVK